MLSLSASERSCFLTLLCYSSVNDNGVITFLNETQLMVQSGLDPTSEEWGHTIGILNKLEKLGIIEVDNGTITVKNWQKRQETNLTSYERVKRHREKKRNDNTKITLEEKRIEENISEPAVSQEPILIVVDGETKPEKPQKFDPLPIFKIFTEVLGVRYEPWVKNKSQRFAAENLSKRGSLALIRSALEYAKENEDEPFIVQILSPWELDNKWDRLKKHKQKHDS